MTRTPGAAARALCAIWIGARGGPFHRQAGFEYEITMQRPEGRTASVIPHDAHAGSRGAGAVGDVDQLRKHRLDRVLAGQVAVLGAVAGVVAAIELNPADMVLPDVVEDGILECLEIRL